MRDGPAQGTARLMMICDCHGITPYNFLLGNNTASQDKRDASGREMVQCKVWLDMQSE